eukprot:g18578.t1
MARHQRLRRLLPDQAQDRPFPQTRHQKKKKKKKKKKEERKKRKYTENEPDTPKINEKGTEDDHKFYCKKCDVKCRNSNDWTHRIKGIRYNQGGKRSRTSNPTST